ncbi:MAG: M20/M25/M40 family metallo-hydrolase [Actinobacteria bacterium]|nr:M20/M25/M40 family metallo-hydrolase [Actinomycetota bacterium]
MITDAKTQELLAALVRIESVTPWLIPSGRGEADVARFMAEWVGDLPVEVMLDEIAPGRVNFVVRLAGSGGGPTLCVNAHADTVGYANWADRALEPVVEGDRMVGLGAADDKAGCAAALLALRALVETGASLKGDLLVACVADEEGVSIGTEDLLGRYAMNAMLIVEPDRLPRVITEHQGFGWIDVVVHGKPAHGSAPDEGVDAIVHMAEVVRRLHHLDREVFAANPDPLNGRTVFHTGTITGGTDYATYPSKAVLGIEIGTQPGETLRDRVADIEAIFDEVREEFPDFRGEVVVQLDRDPFRAEGHEALWEALDDAAVEAIGTHLEPDGLNAWADSGLSQKAGIPTLMFGPLGGNFHAPDEWVSISEVASCARIVEGSVRRFLG